MAQGRDERQASLHHTDQSATSVVRNGSNVASRTVPMDALTGPGDFVTMAGANVARA
jgi:hypothetical protein